MADYAIVYVPISIEGFAAESILSLSINASRSGGTATIIVANASDGTTTAPELKKTINFQGLAGRVERVSTVNSFGEDALKIECRLVPPYTTEYVYLDKIDIGDGTSYKLSDLITEVATQSGANVFFAGLDTEVQSITQFGRVTEVLSSLASMGCAKLFHDGNRFYIGDERYSSGYCSIDSEDLISITTSTQTDFIDEIGSLVMDLADLMMQADDLVEEKETLEDQLAEEEEEDKLVSTRNSLGDVSMQFGWWHRQFKPFDSNIEVITEPGATLSSDAWDYWVPTTNVNQNPNKPSRKYFLIKKEIDQSGYSTGRYMGLFNPIMERLLYPFTAPENSSGLYFARGNSMNISGWPTFEDIWEPVSAVKLTSQIPQADGSFEEVQKDYIEFSIRPDIDSWFDTATDQWTNKYVPDKHQIGFYVQAKVEYIPKITRPWKWSGFISYSLWVIKREVDSSFYGNMASVATIIGAIDVNGNVYGLDGSQVMTIDSIADLPGGGTIGGNALISNDGSICGEYVAGAFTNLSGEHVGMTEQVQNAKGDYVWSKDIKLGGVGADFPSSGACLYLDWNPPDSAAFPGIGSARPTVVNKSNQTISKPDVPVFFNQELPSSNNIDFTGFDPANPDAWTPVTTDPKDTAAKEKQKDDALKAKNAELAIEKNIISQKIACITKRLAVFGVNTGAAEQIRDAKQALKKELKRQQDLGILVPDLIKPLTEALDSAVQLFASALADLDCVMNVTDCTYLYTGIIPVPGAKLSISGGEGADVQATDAGIIESVSVSLSKSSCSATVTANAYGEEVE